MYPEDRNAFRFDAIEKWSVKAVAILSESIICMPFESITSDKWCLLFCSIALILFYTETDRNLCVMEEVNWCQEFLLDCLITNLALARS